MLARPSEFSRPQKRKGVAAGDHFFLLEVKPNQPPSLESSDRSERNREVPQFNAGTLTGIPQDFRDLVSAHHDAICVEPETYNSFRFAVMRESLRSFLGHLKADFHGSCSVP